MECMYRLDTGSVIGLEGGEERSSWYVCACVSLCILKHVSFYSATLTFQCIGGATPKRSEEFRKVIVVDISRLLARTLLLLLHHLFIHIHNTCFYLDAPLAHACTSQPARLLDTSQSASWRPFARCIHVGTLLLD